MSTYYLIMKARQRAWGINPWIPHEVFTTRKTANKRCKELNEKAQNLVYEVISVKNGESKCKT